MCKCSHLVDPTYLIVGQGSIGKPVAEAMAKQGLAVTAVATSTKTYAQGCGVRFCQADVLDLDTNFFGRFSHIIVIVSPKSDKSKPNRPKSQRSSQERVAAYQESYLAIARHLAQMSDGLSVRRVLFVSSTSVYGQNMGEWVDVATPAKPSEPTAQVLLESETVLSRAFGDRLVIVRPSGIYGVDRRRMITAAMAQGRPELPTAHTAKSKPTIPHYTNRIMDTDLVRALVAIATTDQPKPLYLASDHSPAIHQEVLAFIADRLTQTHSQQAVTLDHTTDKLSADEPWLTTGVTGKRIRGNLDITLAYPDYQSGYAWICTQLKSVK